VDRDIRAVVANRYAGVQSWLGNPNQIRWNAFSIGSKGSLRLARIPNSIQGMKDFWQGFALVERHIVQISIGAAVNQQLFNGHFDSMSGFQSYRHKERWQNLGFQPLECDELVPVFARIATLPEPERWPGTTGISLGKIAIARANPAKKPCNQSATG
jgi:hypothetical protein